MVDYMETYAFVGSIITARLLLAIVASVDLELDHIDVVTVFLYGYF